MKNTDTVDTALLSSIATQLMTDSVVGVDGKRIHVRRTSTHDHTSESECLTRNLCGIVLTIGSHVTRCVVYWRQHRARRPANSLHGL
jgi:hypothetical protein